MKTSHKSDEVKNLRKGGGGPQIGYLYFEILNDPYIHTSITIRNNTVMKIDITE
jgi:hypothetical protein